MLSKAFQDLLSLESVGGGGGKGGGLLSSGPGARLPGGNQELVIRHVSSQANGGNICFCQTPG